MPVRYNTVIVRIDTTIASSSYLTICRAVCSYAVAEHVLWFVEPHRPARRSWLFYHNAARRPRTARGRPLSCANSSARNRPVADGSCAATSSGVPCRDDPAAADAAFRPEIDDVVGRLDRRPGCAR